MHIHIHLFAIAIEKQQRERITRGRHQIVIRARKRMQQQTVANQAAVHEHENRIPIVLLHLRARNEAVSRKGSRRFVRFRHLQRAGARFQLDQIFQQLAAEDLKHTLAQRLDRRGMQQSRAAVPQFERLVGMRQAVMRYQRRDVRQFRLLRAQKLLARRNVEEQIAHR